MTKVCLLTGSPGSGKTTVIRKALARTASNAAGFYTEELRTGGIRQGFSLTTLDGTTTTLAHVSISSPYRVGKYGVDIASLDSIGVTALLEAIDRSEVIVIDEIGKMELFSPRFREAVLKAIDSGKRVLGTIMLNAHPFADRVKSHPGVSIKHINRENREQVLDEVSQWLKSPTNEHQYTAYR
jgi:nucleoside-triphosphatase